MEKRYPWPEFQGTAKILIYSAKSLCDICLFVVFLLVSIGVICRFFPSIGGFSWGDEIIELCMAWFAFVGGFFIFMEGDLVQIESLKKYLERKGKVKCLYLVESWISASFGLLLLFGGTKFFSAGWELKTAVLIWPKSWWYLPIILLGAGMTWGSIRNLLRIIWGR